MVLHPRARNQGEPLTLEARKEMKRKQLLGPRKESFGVHQGGEGASAGGHTTVSPW